MRNVRRYDPQLRPVFLTQVCADRLERLRGRESALLGIINELRDETKAKILAHVVMPEHFHLLIDAPNGFSPFMQSLKLRSTRRWALGRIWQTRFYDHIIRDENDLHRHIDYIHFNPVKHGHVDRPEDWPWSSYRNYLRRGAYQSGWGHSMPDSVDGVELD